jgi:hypothetical protein
MWLAWETSSDCDKTECTPSSSALPAGPRLRATPSHRARPPMRHSCRPRHSRRVRPAACRSTEIATSRSAVCRSSSVLMGTCALHEHNDRAVDKNFWDEVRPPSAAPTQSTQPSRTLCSHGGRSSRAEQSAQQCEQSEQPSGFLWYVCAGIILHVVHLPVPLH